MMNNFTKEYIELCKNEKVQWLRPKFEYGDWIFHKFIPIHSPRTTTLKDYGGDSVYENKFRDEFIWLPTGDQLDDEIVKICKENGWYIFEYLGDYMNRVYDYDKSIQIEWASDDNPLIAKIKLLIKLLENNNE